jgi:hypothetical protein
VRTEDFYGLPVGTIVWLDGVRYGVSRIEPGTEPTTFSGVPIPGHLPTPVFVRNVNEVGVPTRFTEQEIARLSFWPPAATDRKMHPRLRQSWGRFQDRLLSDSLKGPK